MGPSDEHAAAVPGWGGVVTGVSSAASDLVPVHACTGRVPLRVSIWRDRDGAYDQRWQALVVCTSEDRRLFKLDLFRRDQSLWALYHHLRLTLLPLSEAEPYYAELLVHMPHPRSTGPTRWREIFNTYDGRTYFWQRPDTPDVFAPPARRT